MPTIRLIPSTYYLSSTSYLSVSNAANMYTNTDSDTYATVTNSQNGTTSYYIYLRGFNFSDIPSGAIINSWTVKLKARESGITTSSSYAPKLCNNTSQITSTCSAVSTTANTLTFTGVSADWDDIVGYGANFGIRINCRRASRNTTGYMYIYGAEILVDYTVPNPATVTSTLTGDGTISPSGAISTYDDAQYTLTITPTNKADTVTATKNGVDITADLVAHGAGDTLSLTADDVTTSGIQSGSSYASYCVGHSAESPSSSGSSSNMYASSGSTGYAAYSFDFSDIPSNATIEAIEVRAYGHRENASIDSTHVSQCVLYSGSSAISDDVDFPSTSNSMITITPDTLPTRSSLDGVTLRHYVGYYGGLVLGITFEITYSTGSGIDHYTYTYTVSGDATIAVTIGGGGGNPPVITVGTPNREIISAVTDYDQCVCTFTSDLALSQWEARATKAGVTPARGVGLLVESGGALAAGATGTVYVENEELTNGDGVYTVTVYGQSTGGVWSE